MTRRIALVIVGLALMLGLYLYDRGDSSETTVTATVVGVEERDDTDGPETWHITVTLPSGPVTLEPLAKRPDLNPDDTICVTVITRAGQPDTHRRAAAGADC